MTRNQTVSPPTLGGFVLKSKQDGCAVIKIPTLKCLAMGLALVYNNVLTDTATLFVEEVFSPRFKYKATCSPRIASATNEPGTRPGLYIINPLGEVGLRIALKDSCPPVDVSHGRMVYS